MNLRTLLVPVLLWGLATAVAEGAGEGERAERLVFLLQYVGADYVAAVRDGEIVSELEYREMVDFGATAEAELEALRPHLPADEARQATEGIRRIRRLIAERADPKVVRDETGRVIPILLDVFALKPVPRALPRTDRAADLYHENCATCHGADGRGNGPDAARHDPPPARFDDPERMNTAAPFVFYNAITFGIPGTAMASFRDSFDEQERWDLAFFVWRFISPATVPETGPDLRLSLRDLATRSSADLVPGLVEQARARGADLDPRDAAALVAWRRGHPEPAGDHEEHLAEVREELRRSVDFLDRGDLRGAADRVTSAYLEHFEPLEPDIDRLDTTVRQRFERSLIDFRKALREDRPDEARKVADDLLAAVADAERLLVGSKGGGRGTVLLLAGIAALLIGGMAAMALRG